MKAIQMIPYTHFLSLPLNDATLQNNVNQLSTEISEKGFDSSLFISNQQLHLTVVMLKLYNEDLKQKAIQLLEKYAPAIYDLLVR
jgi:activating signal cointegrator complex subunit 1